ncbi:MAG: MotA/TolQ/ExbB proton channel family protein [Myxococcales bacterium]|nr:MotA/TolQ/ExbB proton channel family protein [Myxococcales bacterium]
MDAEALLKLLQDGGLTVYPLSVASIISLAILFERLWRFRGIDSETRRLTRQTVEALVKRDVATARRLCEESKTPVAGIYLDAMRWKNIAVEDLERVLATSRQEAASDLKRGLWVVGTIGSLAPYVGLFGTVVGIIRAFQDMALHGAGGFEVVAAGISEALVATGAGLFVAITALLFFNYLQVRVTAISGTYARSCERFVQALLYVESASAEAEERSEPSDGRLVPA